MFKISSELSINSLSNSNPLITLGLEPVATIMFPTSYVSVGVFMHLPSIQASA